MCPRASELPVPKLPDTFSFWLTACGLLSRKRFPKLAGGVLLTVGLGYLGVLNERRGQGSISGHLHRGKLPYRSLATHSLIGYWGWRLLSGAPRGPSDAPGGLK